jgi:ribosomal protein L7Ae-like RNA K-turn-binding protein
MSRKTKPKQKQILHLEPRILMPSSRVDSNEVLLSLIQSLKAAKHITVGINSVARAMVNGRVKLLIFSGHLNPPEIFDHILVMASRTKIPVVATNIDPRSMGKSIGLRSASVIGVLNDVNQELIDVLMPFAETVDTSHLPFVRMETDVFVPDVN